MRWSTLHLLAAVRAKRTGIKTRTEGIETLQHVEGIRLTLKGGALMALCGLRGAGFEGEARVLRGLILFGREFL